MIFVVAGSRKQADDFAALSGREVKYVSSVQDLHGHRPEDMEVYYFGTYDLRDDLGYISTILRNRGVEAKHITWMELQKYGLG